jgi:hypothetical protein
MKELTLLLIYSILYVKLYFMSEERILVTWCKHIVTYWLMIPYVDYPW